MHHANPNRYSQAEIDAVYRVIRERRDMRHFISKPIPTDILQRLLEAAHFAPSVGYMQPWRFIRITNQAVRKQIYTLVDEERMNTADALGERRNEFMRLKVEGILDCGELLVTALCDNREKHIFGRRTLPEMDLASVSAAIQNMWLAARAEGLGMGWVSLFDPEQLGSLLRMPTGSKPIAILCLGYVEQFYNKPMLSQQNWAHKQNLADLLFENSWGNSTKNIS